MNYIETLPQLGYSVSNMLSVAVLVLVGVYVIFTTIFYYHWINYASNAKVTSLTMLVYFACTLPLVALMLGASFVI